mgnify:CR=1 FL=1
MKNIIKKNKSNKEAIFFLLSYLGVIPFIALTLLIWLLDEKNLQKFSDLLIFYTYLIFTFVGAVYWGITIKEKNQPKFRLVISILPVFIIMIIEFFINLLIIKKIILIILFFNLFLIFEVFLFKKKVIPKWFYLLRVKLNVIVTFFLLLALIKVF